MKNLNEIENENMKQQEHHGMRHTPEYAIWSKMIYRCENPRAINFGRYGGAGISVCPEWRRSFAAFYRDMGSRPPGMSLDRIDNSKGYSASNCKWSTQVEQQNNRKDNVRVTFGGKTQTVIQWCKELGLLYKTIRARFLRGNWTAERALTTPINTQYRKKQ